MPVPQPASTNTAAHFHDLHTGRTARPLVLPNAWDAASARIVEEAGAHAIATTSAGIAWSRGFPDGQRIGRAEMLAEVARIVRAVRVPVTADVESGYGTGSSDDAAETARAVIGTGAVGLNLEDAPGLDGAPIVDPSYHAARIRAVRDAAEREGVRLFINARTDTYVRKIGIDDAARFDETVRRARIYLEAGADGIFVPLAPDAVIGQLVQAIDAPVNVIGGPGAPRIDELRALGVARVSLGPHLARAMYALVRRAATEVLGTGTYDTMRDQITSPELNALLAPRE